MKKINLKNQLLGFAIMAAFSITYYFPTFARQEKQIIQPSQSKTDQHAPLLVHLKQAQKDLEIAIKAGKEAEGKHLYNARLQRIKHYYRDGEYQADIENICAKAEHYFKNHKAGWNSIVIFDIDDTALISYTKTDNFCFLWDVPEECDEMRKILTGMPIKPVLHLYNTVKELQYKTVFLSSLRSFQLRWGINPLQFNTEKIAHRLQQAGYTNYEDLILKSFMDTSDTAT